MNTLDMVTTGPTLIMLDADDEGTPLPKGTEIAVTYLDDTYADVELPDGTTGLLYHAGNIRPSDPNA